jgi:hypothetical protein
LYCDGFPKGHLLGTLGYDMVALGAREEIDEIDNAIFMNIACL